MGLFAFEVLGNLFGKSDLETYSGNTEITDLHGRKLEVLYAKHTFAIFLKMAPGMALERLKTTK